MHFYKYILSFITGVIFIGLSQSLHAQFDIPKAPDFQTSVYDYIKLLSPSEKNALEQKLIKYSDTTSTQIVIAIISSTEGENINYLGTQWAHSWGIGQEKEDNGIFILLAKDDRKIAISTGYGVEHLLTDALSRRIIENNILPYFKQNDYFGGLNHGADAIFEVMTGEYEGTRESESESSGSPIALIIVIIIVIIAIIISRSKNNRGGGKGGKFKRRSVAGTLLDAIILSNLGRSGFGGKSGGFGGSSGGGFGGGGFGGGFGGGGFGGGGFGGGGASGGW